MIYLNNEIELKINEQEIEISPSEFSFSLKSSIHDFFNTVDFTFHDMSGLLQEAFLLTEGVEVEISYGIESDVNKCSYVISRDELDEPDRIGLMAGQVDIELIHKWYDEQEVISKGYSQKISSIIRSLTNSYSKGFSELDIETTVNNDIWYQPLMTDAKFISKILLPNAYSYSANETPFYCYITSDNIFHFKSANKMYTTKAVDTFTFEVDQPETINQNTIMNLQRWKKGTYLYRHQFHQKTFRTNPNSGALETDDDYLFNHPPTRNKVLPFIMTKDRMTGFFDVGYGPETTAQSENLLGQVNNSFRESMCIERFLISIPFYPKLKAGNSINLNIFMVSASGKENTLSGNYSSPRETKEGEYVVEDCIHHWNGEEKRSFTELLIGRKYVDVPDSYTLREKLKQV